MVILSVAVSLRGEESGARRASPAAPSDHMPCGPTAAMAQPTALFVHRLRNSAVNFLRYLLSAAAASACRLMMIRWVAGTNLTPGGLAAFGGSRKTFSAGGRPGDGA